MPVAAISLNSCRVPVLSSAYFRCMVLRVEFDGVLKPEGLPFVSVDLVEEDEAEAERAGVEELGACDAT